MEWIQERSDRWVSGPYVVQKVAAPDRPKGRRFEVVGTPGEFARGRVHDTIKSAQAACSYEEALRQIVADAPPLTSDQRTAIAQAFSGGRVQDRLERKPRPAGAPPPKGLTRKRLRHEIDPSSKDESSQVRSQPNWGQSQALVRLLSVSCLGNWKRRRQSMGDKGL